ncbi:MAG: RNA polymerase sigma factor [Burkholderiales bacterium]
MSPSPDPAALPAHVPGLRRYARLLTGDAHRADDLVQDTLERACRALGRWPEPGRLRPWLLSVMHNLFVDHVRARRALDEADPLEDAPPAALVQSGDLGRDVQIRLDLGRALQRLPLAHREVLLLVCLEDCGYDEAAAILGVPVGTVMSRLSRARAQLRIEMEGGADATPRLRRVK